MSELVERLSSGRHPVILSLRPAPNVALLKESLDRGFVYIKFTGTRGGTELGVTIDRERTAVDRSALESRSGIMKVIGDLTLDSVPVRCIADIDLATFAGEGYLEKAS
jgi:hypothetical protein